MDQKKKLQSTKIQEEAGFLLPATTSEAEDTQPIKPFASKNLPPKQTQHDKQKQLRRPWPSVEATNRSTKTGPQLRKPHGTSFIPETKLHVPSVQDIQQLPTETQFPRDSRKLVQTLLPESSKNPPGSTPTVPQLRKPSNILLIPETKLQLPQQQIQQPQPPIATSLLTRNHEVQTSFKDLTLNIPRRKDLRVGGTRGIPCVVETNHISLNINPKFEIAIHYDVNITPEPRKSMIRKIWETFRVLHLKNYSVAFDDRKNAYTPSFLPWDSYSGEVLVSDDDNSKQVAYKVVIKFAAEVNLRGLFDYMASGCKIQISQDALQCVDVVLRNVCSLRFVKVGRCFFSEPRGQIIQLGNGMELWHGHFQSAGIGWKPFLNVDIANKGFPSEQPVIDLMVEMAKSELKYITDEALNKISSFLKGLKVQYEIPNHQNFRRVYRVNSFMDTPDRAKFILDDGQQMSVLDYYAQVKKYKIKYPYLPVLWVGTRIRKIYLPPELCTILPGQATLKQLNEIQTTNFIRNVTTSTEIRKEKIMQCIQQINFNADSVVKAFGLSIGQTFEKVNARVLAPPMLQYKNGTVKPSKGVWRAAEFLQTQSLENNSWTVLNLDRRTTNDSIANFVHMLMSSAKQLGMQIGYPARPYETMDRFNPSKFEEFLHYNSLKLIIVIIPEYPTNVYSQVKQKAELVVGRLTQCIKSKTMFKMNASTVGNILLKINSKINGHNHTIAANYRPPCLQKPCIIMGADVTHPAPGLTDIPSIAAVTASCDPKAFQYNFSWRFQPARQEIIQELESIVKEQLMFFRRTSNQIPQRIIFFRDGVSEGQFKQVMNEEVRAIRRACSSLGTPGSYRPAITFLVVQKRHHTRFFPTNRNESDDKYFNVRAGTVVDTIITHPTDIEYYLVSHASILGVARPTKYRVLWDDHSTSEDELQTLTYYLCHMFSRCTRSMSYPAPTYYAHLAALRARVYHDGQTVNLNNLDNEQKLRTIKHDIMRGKPMFFV